MHDAKREVRVHSGLTSTWAGASCAVRRVRAASGALLLCALALQLSACGPQAGGQSGTECNSGDPGLKFNTQIVSCACQSAGLNSVVAGTVVAQDDANGSVKVSVSEVLANASGVTAPEVGVDIEGTLLPCSGGLTTLPNDEVIVVYVDHEEEIPDELVVLPVGDPLLLGDVDAPAMLPREDVDKLVDSDLCAQWSSEQPDAGQSSIMSLTPVEDQPAQCVEP